MTLTTYDGWRQYQRTVDASTVEMVQYLDEFGRRCPKVVELFVEGEKVEGGWTIELFGDAMRYREVLPEYTI